MDLIPHALHMGRPAQVKLIPCLVINKYTDSSNYLVIFPVFWQLKTFSIEYKKIKTINMMFLSLMSKYTMK